MNILEHSFAWAKGEQFEGMCIAFGGVVAIVSAFVWSRNPTFHASGIALAVFGLSLIVIDYFSKERAAIYYQHILQLL